MSFLRQKVAFNTAIQIVGKVVSVCFTLLTVSLLTGYLGVAGFGRYIYLLTWLVLFSSLADWGTNTIGARELAKNSSPGLLGKLLVLKAAFSIVAIGGLLLVLPAPLAVLALFLLFKMGRDYLAMIWQARLEMHKTAITDVVASGLIFLISWLFVQRGGGVNQLLLAYFLATFLALILGIALIYRQTELQFNFSFTEIRPLLAEILPMGGILLMFTMDNKIDTLMLGMIKGSEAVGIYGIAYRVYDVLILGAAFLMNALLPVFSRWQNLNRWGSRLERAYQQAFDLLLVGGLLLAVGVYFGAPLLVGLLAGGRFAEFYPAVGVMRLLTVAVFLAYLNHLTGYTIVALGKQRPYFFVALASLVFNVAVNLVVIPRYSFYGAAVVTILTEALVLTITTGFICKLLHFAPSVLSFPATFTALAKQVAKNIFPGRPCRQQT